jgi:antirestriction protein
MTKTYTPSIWCGTYAKYNAGNLDGQWFDLEDYADKDELYAAFQAYHGPGEHEFMFNDHQDIPGKYVGESFISPDVWDEWVSLDNDDKELLEVYQDNIDGSATLAQAQEAFEGKCESKEDWAQDYWENTGLIESIPDSLQSYIDYASYARDCEMSGDITFVERGYHDVWVFNSN